MYAIPLRWCPPTTNMDFNSSSSQNRDLEGGDSEIPEVENKKTCHQCRRKRSDIAATCKNMRNRKPCGIRLCRKCLLNRYGETEEEVELLTDWMCPVCRGICNCSYCMKKGGQKPTGALSHKAKASGFKSVSEMLIKKAYKDLELNKINNSNVLPSNKTTLEKVHVQDPYVKENTIGGMTHGQMNGPEA